MNHSTDNLNKCWVHHHLASFNPLILSDEKKNIFMNDTISTRLVDLYGKYEWLLVE